MVHADDPTQGWSLRSRWKYSLEDPPKEVMATLISAEKDNIEKQEAQAEDVLGKLPGPSVCLAYDFFCLLFRG